MIINQIKISLDMVCNVIGLVVIFTLRKLLRDDLVISVKLYSTSFVSFVLIILKKYILPTFKYILIGSMFGKKSIDEF